MLTLLIYEFKNNKGRLTSSDVMGISNLHVLHSACLTYDRTPHIVNYICCYTANEHVFNS
jgi:hypothetical protein